MNKEQAIEKLAKQITINKIESLELMLRFSKNLEYFKGVIENGTPEEKIKFVRENSSKIDYLIYNNFKFLNSDIENRKREIEESYLIISTLNTID